MWPANSPKCATRQARSQPCRLCQPRRQNHLSRLHRQTYQGYGKAAVTAAITAAVTAAIMAAIMAAVMAAVMAAAGTTAVTAVVGIYSFARLDGL